MDWGHTPSYQTFLYVKFRVSEHSDWELIFDWDPMKKRIVEWFLQKFVWELFWLSLPVQSRAGTKIDLTLSSGGSQYRHIILNYFPTLGIPFLKGKEENVLTRSLLSIAVCGVESSRMQLLIL